eukprot:TRINITY_DN1006_c0_g1_i1.p1 TRINITY_DN1006_c0_g1~~TRINITY_DN1006_c0_g1_i1.p1  ORF type:complete len:432 (-),score=87.60 TRINITY_DN1006_c0_g1_i1:1375-2670(-)
MINSTKSMYDVVIVGGGMVGATMAAALSHDVFTKGLRMAIIDRAEKPQIQEELNITPDARVSTVTPRSQALFEKVGMWEQLKPPKSRAFASMQVWDNIGSGYIHWESQDSLKDVMAHVVENSLIQQVAIGQLQDNVECLWSSQVANVVLPQGNMTSPAKIQLQEGDELLAKLVIGADGGKSVIREMAHMRTVGFSYDQRGVVATVETTPCDEVVAWQKFLPNGPMALLPVRDGFYNIVWSTSHAQAKQLEQMDELSFADAVNDALETAGQQQQRKMFLPKFVRKGKTYPFVKPPKVLRSVGGPVKSFPLTLMHSGRYVRERLALIGDAGHVVHPLAGQGVNLGFGDVEEMLKMIKYTVQSGQDIGNVHLLQDYYEMPRQQENLVMMCSLDALRRTFAANPTGFGFLRNVGMDFINNVPVLRNLFMNYAMGR